MLTQVHELEGIGLTHHSIDSDGCPIHVVEAGEGPAVVLCHGFPEFWMSWRRQIPALANAGYRVLALDLRGHGESGCPEDLIDYSVLHTVGDVIAVLDHLGIVRATIVGHDAGTTTAYHAALMRPDRINGVFGLSVAYVPRGPLSLIDGIRMMAPPEHYILYFQEPGVAEAELDGNVREFLRRIIYGNSGRHEGGPIAMMAMGGTLIPNLPEAPDSIDFLPDDELDLFVEAFEHTGFRSGINGYRVFGLNWDLTSPWPGADLPVDSAYMGGNLDTVLTMPGQRAAAEAMGSASFIDGVGHFIHAEAPDVVNAELLRFLASRRV